MIKTKNSTKWGFQDMEVGDSFEVKILQYDAVSQSLLNFQRGNPGKRFTLRKTSETRYRCWRTE